MCEVNACVCTLIGACVCACVFVCECARTQACYDVERKEFTGHIQVLSYPPSPPHLQQTTAITTATTKS